MNDFTKKVIKGLIHVPAEQYGYFEVEYEDTIENVANLYMAVSEEYKRIKNAIPKTLEERIKRGEKVTKEEIIKDAKVPF